MGWRISFGVGPLRYSAPLTSRRRRSTRRYVSQPTYQHPEFNPVPYDRRLSRREKKLLFLIFGGLVVFLAIFVVWSVMNPTP